MSNHQQKMRRWTQLLALVLMALLGVITYVLWLDTLHNRQLKPALEIATQIRIQRPAQPDMLMQRQDDDSWLLLEPCYAAVDQQRLEPLLAALQPAAHHYQAEEVDLDAAGLLKPLASVVLNNSTILVGDTDLRGERRYIQRDNRVEFAPEWILSLINGGTSAFAKLNVFEVDITGIAVKPMNDDTAQASSTDPQDWQNMTAQQVLSWPIADAGDALSTHKLEVHADTQTQLATVFRYAQFTAIQFEAASRPPASAQHNSTQCAYILPSDTLPISYDR